MDGLTDRRMDGYTNGWRDGRSDGLTDGQKDGQMDGETDRWMDGQIKIRMSQMDSFLENGESIWQDRGQRDLTILVKNQ